MIRLFFDGSVIQSTRRASCGWVLKFGDFNHMNGIDLGHATHNEAEYFGLIYGLMDLNRYDFGTRKLTVYGDSKMVICQMKGEWRVKSKSIYPLWDKAQGLSSYWDVEYVWIPRKENSIADEIARNARENE